MNNLEKNVFLDAILNYSNAIIICLSKKFIVTELSISAEAFYNWQHQEVCGKNFLELCQSFGYISPIDPNFFTNPKLLKISANIKNFSGIQKNVNWIIAPILLLNNQVDGAVLIGENVEMKKGNIIDHLMEIIDCIPGCLYWKDCNGRYLGCNKVTAELAGLNSVYDIIGKTDPELWGSQASFLSSNDQQVLASGKTITVAEKIQIADGRWLSFTGVKMPLRDENNKIIGIIGNSLDITAEKEAARLKQEKKAAEQKTFYLRTAAGSIAHDLRTPLSSIKFAMNAIEAVLPQLLEAYQLAHIQRVEIQPIRSNKLQGISTAITRCKDEIDFSNHYIDLILGNLKYDTIDTSNYEHHDIIKIIDYSLETYPYQANERALIHWHPTIDFNFFGNDFYLKNILNNLLKNSLFYIKKHERGEIFITTDETDNYYLLKVKDTAQGAPPEVIQHMFDGYYSKREGGTGLGLAFCKTIMESFGGNIHAESIESEYMLFILSFPKMIDNKNS